MPYRFNARIIIGLGYLYKIEKTNRQQNKFSTNIKILGTTYYYFIYYIYVL